MTTATNESTITEHEAAQVERANASTATPVVFVHGLWLLPSSWDRWVKLFEEAGYVGVTPGWPDDPETVAEAREHPEVFAGKGIREIADYEEAIIRRLDRKPVIIGHSFGGLLTMILAGRGLAAASLAISPAPFRGVLPLPIPALRTASVALRNPANWNRAVPLSYEQFRYSFANAVGEDEAKELYLGYSVPGAGEPSLPGGVRELQSVVRGEGQLDEPGAGSDADHLGRLGPYGPLGDRERVLQKGDTQQERDRDRQDAGPRARADNRRRLAGGRREGARVRQAVHKDHGESGVKQRRTPVNNETASYKQETVAPAKTFVNRDTSQTRLIADVSVPDSALITAVIEHAQRLSEPYLFNHAMRSWLFAEAIGRIKGIDYDREVVAVGTILHDIGLTASVPGPNRFEVNGADAVLLFIKGKGLSDRRRQLIWDLVALNSTPSLALHKEPEVAVGTMGIGLDYGGFGVEAIPTADVERILSAFPRLRMKQRFAETCSRLVTAKPETSHDNFLRDFGERFVPGYKTVSTVDLLMNAPFDE
jgi:pimeloyl-ACP methyl ester carboxylesterase